MTPTTVDLPPHVARVLAGFRGASVVSVQERGEPEPPHEGVDETRDINIPIFGWMGPALWRNGWSVYPQTRRARTTDDTRTRTPVIIDGQMLRIRDLRDALPSADDIRYWALAATSENVAAVMGPASGVFAIDGDITDPVLARAVLHVFLHELGPQHFQRTADGVKFCLYVRMDPADPVDGYRKLALLDPEGRPIGDQAIEILGPGASSTIAGRHHKSGLWFKYMDLHPAKVPLSEIAVISKGRLQEILDRIHAEVVLLKGIKGYDKKAPYVATGEVEGVRVGKDGFISPPGRKQVRTATYVNGKVTDGREQYLFSRGLTYCLHYPDAAATDAGRRDLAARLTDEARETWDGPGSHYGSWDAVLRAAFGKICQGRDHVIRNPGKYTRRIGRDENGAPVLVQRVAVAVQRDGADTLAWLSEDLLGGISLTSISTVDQAAKARARAIVDDPAVRQAEEERVVHEVQAAIIRWIDEAYERAAYGDDAPSHPLTILKAPVGAGKTSRLIELLAERKRLNGPMGRPVLILMPSYANIAEAVERATKRKPTAEEATTVFKNAVAAMTQAAEEAGLNVGVLTGKERGGCKMGELLALARAARLPTNALCEGNDETAVDRQARLSGNRKLRSRRKAGEDVGPDERAPRSLCHHHPDNEAHGAPRDCSVILGRRALVRMDIVFAPLTFIQNALPSDLARVFCAKAVDERAVFEMMGHTVMSVSTLERERAAPPVSDAEAEAGLTAEGLLADRTRVARVAVATLSWGEDVALAIHRHADSKALAGCVESALMVTRRGQRTAKDMRPNMSVDELRGIVEKPTQGDLIEETVFWSHVRDRLLRLAEDDVTISLAGGSPDPRLLKACGDKDRRIQVLAAGQTGKDKPVSVRLSWRSVPNLSHLPTILLDASADVDMISKVWSGREIRAVNIKAYLHVRTVALLDGTYATSGLDPSGIQDRKTADRVSKRLTKVRRAENALAHIYGQGRFLTVGAKRVRKALRIGYGETDNVDSGHFGAIKGLDFARDHLGVLTVGRHEFPHWVVDALAACLSYDDPEPEAPFNATGDGIDPATGESRASPQVERIYPLRDGRDLKISVPELPGRWAAKVQRQFREEELIQAMGRLRPVYREGVAPVWVAMGKVLPEGVIIDGITDLDNLSNPAGAGLLFDAVRRVGVLDLELLQRQAKDLSGILGFPAMMRRVGLDKPGTPGPFSAGFDVYRVRLASGEREVLVPGYHADGESALVQAFDRSAIKVLGVQFVVKGADLQPSRRKAMDKVDQEIGTRDERAEAEETARDRILTERCEALLLDPRNWIGDGRGARMVADPIQDVAAAVVLATQGSVSPDQDPDDEPPVPPAAPPPTLGGPRAPATGGGLRGLAAQAPEAPRASRCAAGAAAAAPAGASASPPAAGRYVPRVPPPVRVPRPQAPPS